MTLNARIIHRKDTEANWLSNNPVLAEGEIGIVTDKNDFKIGDGTTHFADLPYGSSSKANLDGGNTFSGDQIINGNVGIGTNNPTEKLDVNGSIKTIEDQGFLTERVGTTTVMFRNFGEDNGHFIHFLPDLPGTTNYTYFGYNGNINSYTFFSKISGTNTSLLKIQGDTGNVGIGTDSPTEKLEVDGNIVNHGWIQKGLNMKTYNVDNVDDLIAILKSNNLPEDVRIILADGTYTFTKDNWGAGEYFTAPSNIEIISASNDKTKVTLEFDTFTHTNNKKRVPSITFTGSVYFRYITLKVIEGDTSKPWDSEWYISPIRIGYESAFAGNFKRPNLVAIRESDFNVRCPYVIMSRTNLTEIVLYQNTYTTLNVSEFVHTYANRGQVVLECSYDSIPGTITNSNIISNIGSNFLHGNVGIGTDNPSEKLEVNGNIKVNTGSGSGEITNVGGDETYRQMNFIHSDSNKVWQLSYRSESEGGKFNTYFFDGSNRHLATSITQDLNVGIGTDNPFSILNTKVSSTGIADGITLQNTDGGTIGAGVGISFNVYGSKISTGRIDNIRTSTGHYALSFSTYGSSGIKEQVRILGNGNVGIGTTTPGSKLSIVGLPTSPTGLSTGDVRNDNGTLRIVT